MKNFGRIFLSRNLPIFFWKPDELITPIRNSQGDRCARSTPADDHGDNRKKIRKGE